MIGIKGAQLPRVSWDYFCNIKIPMPSLDIQKAIADKLDEEQSIVQSNRVLISLFEDKIRNKIASVWGE